jgi:hypothetical protein
LDDKMALACRMAPRDLNSSRICLIFKHLFDISSRL